MRLFLAINFPDALRRAMHDAVAPLRAVASAVSWVGEDRLHLTVKFLGERTDGDAATVAGAMTGAAARHEPLPVVVAGVGAFPNFRRPRVVWMGVSADAKLELLHHDLEMACADVGIEPEGRAFRPHVTLGRVRQPATPEAARAMARTARTVKFREDALVTTVDLMASELAPSGSRYTVVASARLGGT